MKVTPGRDFNSRQNQGLQTTNLKKPKRNSSLKPSKLSSLEISKLERCQISTVKMPKLN